MKIFSGTILDEAEEIWGPLVEDVRAKNLKPAGPPGVLEEILEGVLLLPLHTEPVPYQRSTDSDQSVSLFSLSVDAATVHTKKDY